MMHILLNILGTLCAVYILILVVFYVSQRSILYHPDKNLQAPQNYGLPDTVMAVTVHTEDKVDITVWTHQLNPDNNQPVILYFHGNAGHIGDRSNKLNEFIQSNLSFVAVSYRGYGSSEGKPSEQGLYNDARAAMQYLLVQGYKQENVIIYGESLGSGVAVQLATEHQGKAVILEAPYKSIAALGKAKYPFLPVDLILKDPFHSILKMGLIKSPLLIVHGELDQVIPAAHGQALYNAANEPKHLKLFADTDHSDYDMKALMEVVNKFIHAL